MCKAMPVGRFVNTADVIPNLNGYEWIAVILKDQNLQAIGES